MTEWWAGAACRGADPDLFFEPINAYRANQRFCSRCPVKTECTIAGLGEEFGIWGGLDPRQRLRFPAGSTSKR